MMKLKPNNLKELILKYIFKIEQPKKNNNKKHNPKIKLPVSDTNKTPT